MKCFFCGKENEWKRDRTNHIVDFEEHIIIIKNVPCMVCPYCGEVHYDNDVSTKLDELFHKAKSTLYAYAEIDYEDAEKKVYRLVKELVNEDAISRVAEITVTYGGN